MLKQQSILEVVMNGRVYQLSLPSDSPLGEVHDVLYKMKGFIVERLLEAQKQTQTCGEPEETEVATPAEQ